MKNASDPKQPISQYYIVYFCDVIAIIVIYFPICNIVGWIHFFSKTILLKIPSNRHNKVFQPLCILFKHDIKGHSIWWSTGIGILNRQFTASALLFVQSLLSMRS